jgi:nitrite reductase/ring-hydroxylating ferredoxin subunit
MDWMGEGTRSMDIQGIVMTKIAAWTGVVKTKDLPDAAMIDFEKGGFQIAVYNVGGAYFATENICTHAYAKLTDGWLEGNEIECPLHGGRFDVKTGQALNSPLTCNVKTFPVRVNGEEVEVLLPGAAHE